MTWHFPILSLSAALATASLATSTAYAVAPLDPVFQGVDVENKLGQPVDRNIPLAAPDGKTVTLGDFLDGLRERAPDEKTAKETNTPGTAGRPVLLTLNYFRCTSLCSQQLNQLLITLKEMGWAPGPQKFRIVTVSFDPSDTIEVAAGKQLSYRVELARAMAEANDEDDVSDAELQKRAADIDWTFLVGREKAIAALTKNLGYAYRYDAPSNQYAHSPVVYVLSADGIIERYLWGLNLPPQDLKFALMDASDGVLGSFGEKILSSCFVFDSGGYHAFAWGIMRIGASLLAVIFGLWLFRFWRREKKRKAEAATPGLPTNFGPAGAGAGGGGLGPRGA